MAQNTPILGKIKSSESAASLDAKYGPYASTTAANAALGEAGDDVITAGLTVGITQQDGGIKEWWYQPDQSNVLELVEKGGGTEVEANPTGEATTPLNKIKIGETNYNIPQTDTSNLATKTELQQGLASKQDIINDLSTIRSGAAAGATSVQPAALNNYVQKSQTTGLLKNDGTVFSIPYGSLFGGMVFASPMQNIEVDPDDHDFFYVCNGGGTYQPFGLVIPDNGLVNIIVYDEVQTSWKYLSTTYTSAKIDALIQAIPASVGVVSITTSEDGSLVFTFTNGDTTTVDLNHSHPQYYSKAVETSVPSGGCLPDLVYNLGSITNETVTITFAAAVNGNVNHYFVAFDTDASMTGSVTITLPSGASWADTSGPAIQAGKHYEISILNGVAMFMEV